MVFMKILKLLHYIQHIELVLENSGIWCWELSSRQNKRSSETFPTDNGRSFRRPFRQLNQAVIDSTIYT